MDDSSCFDDILFGILKECKTLPGFLDSIFGFLSRRTDFYVTAPEPNSPVGLPQGLAERLVRNTFYKWKPVDLSIETNIPEAVVETVVETTVDEEELANDIDNIVVEDDPEPTVITSRKQVDFSSSDCYNGAVCSNYSWSQSISEVDVFVMVPENITTKNLSVKILPQKISIKLKKDDRILLEGDLCQKCKHVDAIWSLDKEKLEIHLEKVTEMWWDCFLQSENKLDITKLDCSRPFEELSDEAQAKIQELTWNQERKRMGLPTSDEMKMHEKLKRAWNAEGSPFKEPFDPNTVVFN